MYVRTSNNNNNQLFPDNNTTKTISNRFRLLIIKNPHKLSISQELPLTQKCFNYFFFFFTQNCITLLRISEKYKEL